MADNREPLISTSATCACDSVYTGHTHKHSVGAGIDITPAVLSVGHGDSVDEVSRSGRMPTRILDTYGHEVPKIVTVDGLKARFFMLGLQVAS